MSRPIVSARVVGDKAVMRALGKLSDAVAGKILATALLAGALPIETQAKVIVPKRTGTLARSIHSEVTDRSKRKAEVHIGTDVEYGPYVEFGTPKMPARPYLRTAFDEKLPKAKKEIKEVLKSQLRKAKGVR